MQPDQQVQFEQPQAYSPDQVGVYPQNVTHPQIVAPPGNVIYVQAPKYSNNAVRMWSYILAGLGMVIGVGGFLGSTIESFAVGYVGCCGLLWASLIPEVIFYHGMVKHNNSTGQGTGWAITNLVFGYLILVGGGIYLGLMLIEILFYI
jgi:hypothetical protein